MIRKKKKKSWFSHSRLYRKVSYSGSCALVAHSLVPPRDPLPCQGPAPFSSQLSNLPFKNASFSGLSPSDPFSRDLANSSCNPWTQQNICESCINMSCCYDVRVHRAARAQRVPGKLPGSKQPLSKGSFRTNHVTKA